MATQAFIGTSGWNYDSWRGPFYEDLPAKQWLRFCAVKFSAIEFRHASWFDDEVAACLRNHNIAVCQSDAADWPMWNAVTTDLVYVRLHGHDVTYASCYSESELRAWAQKVRRWMGEGRDVHIYFDNDAYCHAPFNALRLLALVQESC